MILYLTREELKKTKLETPGCYWTNVVINGVKKLAINSDRENLCIVVEPGYRITFIAEQHGEEVIIKEFENWKQSVLDIQDG